ncbi:MAG: hypothetical protein ACQESP_08965 [Candidatus Muiribacteriota bacterium]
MSQKKIKIILSLGFLVILTKFANVFKQYYLGNYFVFDEKLNFFFYLSGMMVFFVMFADSILQAGFIPFYSRLEFKNRKYFSGSILILFFIISLLYTIILTGFNFFSIPMEKIIFFILFFNCISVFFKILYEARGRFKENALVDFLAVLTFIILIYFQVDIILSLFFSQALRFFIKFCRNLDFFKIKLKIIFNGIGKFLKETGFISAGAFFSHIIIFLNNRIALEFSSGPVLLTYAFMIPAAGSGIISSIFSGTTLNFFSSQRNKYLKNSQGLIGDLIKNFFFPLVIISIFVVFFSKDIIGLIFHRGQTMNFEEIQRISNYLKYSIWHLPIFFIMIIFIRYYNSYNKNKELALYSFFTLIFNISMLFFFIEFFSFKVDGIIIAKVFSDLLFVFFLIGGSLNKIVASSKEILLKICYCFLYTAVIYFIVLTLGEKAFYTGTIITFAVLSFYLKEYVWIFRSNK